jgi:hypothetical protein
VEKGKILKLAGDVAELGQKRERSKGGKESHAKCVETAGENSREFSRGLVVVKR